MKKEEIDKIINYWLGNRKNTMDFSLLKSGVKELLQAQRKDLLKKIEVAENQFKDGYYVFHFTYTSNTGKRIAEINKVNDPLPPDMAYQLAKKHISEFPESVMDWFVENRGVIHILKDINQLLK